MADFYAARAGTNAGAPLDGFLTAVHSRLFSLVWWPPVDERPGYQDAFEEQRARLLCNPGRLFGEAIWDLLRFGHADLAAHAVAMADTTEPRVSAPIAESAGTSKAARTVPSLPNAATLN